MQSGLRGKVVVLTGASRGIGKACALRFAAEGAKLALVATSAERVEGVAAECKEAGAEEARAYGLDVSDHAQAVAFAKQVLEDLGGIDVLVNNAGITRDGVFLRMGEEAWDKVVETNLKGAFNMTKGFTKPLMKKRGSKIINIASVVGIAGNAGQVNYAASKGGLIAMTKALAKELGSRGVCVNAVAPGLIETDMTAELPEEARAKMLEGISLGRMGSGDDVASAVLFLASDLASWITGEVLVVDGGMRL